MKKTVLPILMMCLLCLAACNSKDNSASYFLPKAESLVSFEEGETSVIGVFDCASQSEMKFKLVEPKEAADMEIGLENGELLLSYGDIRCSLESSEKLFGSSKGIETLFEIFSSFSSKEQSFDESPCKFTYSLGEAVLVFNESGKLERITTDEYDYRFLNESIE